MKMGRKAMPIDLLVHKGKKNLTKKEINKRKTAESRIKPKADKVEPPEWLNGKEKEVFLLTVSEHSDLELITNVDVNQLALYCSEFTRYIDERAKGSEADPKELNRLSKEIRAWSSEFGFTPSSRAKLAIQKQEEKEISPEEKMFGDV